MEQSQRTQANAFNVVGAAQPPISPPHPLTPSRPSTSTLSVSQPPNVPLQFNIEHLVLHGFSPSSRHRIGASMQQELARLFTEQGVPSALARSQQIDGLGDLTFNMPAQENPRLVGVRIARVIYRRLSDG
ncbi:MAG: hypothetical protein AAGD25_37290 [Cyanobacteria bacterium P01_F01_bin.150]